MLIDDPTAVLQLSESDDKELLSFLAAKVIENKQESPYDDPLGLTRIINLIS